MATEAVSDLELIADAKRGHAAAFEQLFMRYYPSILAYCKALSGNHHRAEDAVQETALVAFQNIQNFFPDAEFDVWLRAIARRRALEFRRRDLSKLRHVENVIEAAYTPADPQLDERKALSTCMAQLSGRIADVVMRYYFKGESVADIASHCSTNLNSIKTILFRARAALHDCMSRQLGREAAS